MDCVFVYTCHVSVLVCVRGYVLFSLLMQGFMFMYFCVDSLWSRFILDFCKVLAHRLRFPMCLWVKIPGPVTRHPINYPPINKNGNRKAPLSVHIYLESISYPCPLANCPLEKTGVSRSFPATPSTEPSRPRVFASVVPVARFRKGRIVNPVGHLSRGSPENSWRCQIFLMG